MPSQLPAAETSAHLWSGRHAPAAGFGQNDEWALGAAALGLDLEGVATGFLDAFGAPIFFRVTLSSYIIYI